MRRTKKPIVIGKKYNSLTVIRQSAEQPESGKTRWDCLCDCGQMGTAYTGQLNYGSKKTCGHTKAKTITKDGKWISTQHHLSVKASRIMSYAKKAGTPMEFDSLREFVLYLDEIYPKKCPVFGERLVVGTKKHHDMSPSVDKIIPEKGYVRGNIQIISYLANRMKNNASPRQLKQFSKWVMNTL